MVTLFVVLVLAISVRAVDDTNCSNACNKPIDLFIGTLFLYAFAFFFLFLPFLLPFFRSFVHSFSLILLWYVDFLAIDTSASLSPTDMGNLRQFIHDLIPMLAIAPGDDSKVELGISFFWIHNGMAFHDCSCPQWQALCCHTLMRLLWTRFTQSLTLTLRAR